MRHRTMSVHLSSQWIRQLKRRLTWRPLRSLGFSINKFATSRFRSQEIDMDENERQEKLKQQTDDIYREIGRFVVTFEHLMEEVRRATWFITEATGGVTESQREQAEAFAHYAKLTVPDLLKTFQGVAGKCRVATPEGMELVSRVVNACEQLNNDRVTTVHSTWMIGWATEDAQDFSVATGFKHGRTKAQPAFQTTEVTASHFWALTDRTKELIRECRAIESCAMMGRPYTAHLKTDDHGNLTTYGATFYPR